MTSRIYCSQPYQVPDLLQKVMHVFIPFHLEKRMKRDEAPKQLHCTPPLSTESQILTCSDWERRVWNHSLTWWSSCILSLGPSSGIRSLYETKYKGFLGFNEVGKEHFGLYILLTITFWIWTEVMLSPRDHWNWGTECKLCEKWPPLFSVGCWQWPKDSNSIIIIQLLHW